MSNQPEAVILSACRTAHGKFQGALAGFSGTQLGALAIKEAVKRAGIDARDVNECIMGQVVQGGVGQCPGRQAALNGGLPPEVAVMTINKVCGSGLKAVMLSAQAIKAGDGDLFVAGGMESMTNVPYILPTARAGMRLGNQVVEDMMIKDGLWCAFKNWHMGSAAEYTGKKAGVTREEQDEYAYNSHRKACAAMDGGKFKNEIFDVLIPQRKGDPIVYNLDESPRKDISVESLAKLRPAFEKDGTVTAGNAPGINDGASALVVSSLNYAQANGLKPMARVVAYTTAGTPPEELFFAPIFAIQKLMKKMGVTIDHFDLIEANEAFSVQALADGKGLGWDWNRVNVNGGSVALGHPIGASGARILTTLIYALKDRGKKTGLATLCLGGGHAVALAIEMM
jgi:acetyl-CoA C-acetyltransferase